MSTSRAKKKRRQRARDAPAGAATEGPSRAPAADGRHGTGRGEAAKAAPSSPFDVRDGVARPQPPWAPFPLTEIGMAAGLAIFGVGFGTSNAWLLTIGVLVLVVVTGELSLREHFAGFRSHTLLLAVLPVVVVHAVVVLAITPAYGGPLALAVDVVVAGALGWLLHRRYHDAHARARASSS